MARCNWPGPGVWGPPKDPDRAVAVVREAVAAGVNHIDTAHFYGPHSGAPTGQHCQPQEVAQIVGQHEELQLDPDLEYQKRTLPRKLPNRLILRAVHMLTAANFFPFDSIVPLRAGALEVSSFYLILNCSLAWVPTG